MNKYFVVHRKIYTAIALILVITSIVISATSIIYAKSDKGTITTGETSGLIGAQTRDQAENGGKPVEYEVGYAIGSPEYMLESIVYRSTAGQSDRLKDDLNTFAVNLNEVITEVNETVCQPLGYVVLTLFGLFEIFSIVTARDALKGEAMYYSFMRMLIKLAIAKLVVDKSRIILYALFDITLTLIAKTELLFKPVASSPAAQSLDAFFTELGNLSTFERLSASVILILAWVCVVGANILCEVIIAGRFITIYVLIAVSPIALAFFVNESQSEIAKGFLKRYFAECLQGFLLFLVISIFPYIFNNVSTSAGLTDWLLGCVVNSLVLIATVKGTSSLAKGIVNVM